MTNVFFRGLLALLPVLAWAGEVQAGLGMGLAAVVILALAWGIFTAAHSWIPRLLYRGLFLLLILALGAAAKEFLSLAPFFLISLVLLVPPEFFRPRKKWGKMNLQMIQGGLVFAMALGVHGTFAQFLSQAGFLIFDLPAGSFLLIGLVLAAAGKK